MISYVITTPINTLVASKLKRLHLSFLFLVKIYFLIELNQYFIRPCATISSLKIIVENVKGFFIKIYRRKDVRCQKKIDV